MDFYFMDKTGIMGKLKGKNVYITDFEVVKKNNLLIILIEKSGTTDNIERIQLNFDKEQTQIAAFKTGIHISDCIVMSINHRPKYHFFEQNQKDNAIGRLRYQQHRKNVLSTLI